MYQVQSCVHVFKILRACLLLLFGSHMCACTFVHVCTLCIGSKDADITDDAGSGNCKKQGEYCIISQ